MRNAKNKNRLLKTNVCLLILSVSACSVGPDFKKPEIVAPSSFTRDEQLGLSPNQQTGGINTKWWRVYGSEEINQLVELALKHNPSIESSIANLQVAQENVRAQQGFFFPQIGANYAVTRQSSGPFYQPAINQTSPTDNSKTNFSSNVNPIYTIQNAGFTVGYLPDIWGGNRRLVEGLKANANAQNYQFIALQTTIANNVVASAMNEALLREQLKAVQELSFVSKKIMDHAVRLNQQGYSSSVDLAYAQSIYAQAISQVPMIEKAREQNLNLLASLCGKFPSEKMLAPSVLNIQLPASLPTAIPSNFVKQRPDIQIAEENVRIANSQIGVAIANMLPQISITATAGSAGQFFKDLQDSGNMLWSLAGGVNQPIFQGGSLFARKRAAEAGLVAAAAQYKSAVINAFQNVADTLYAINADGKFYTTAAQNENATRVIYELSTKQLEKGYISEPVLLQTQVTYLQARINALQAYGTYLGDTASLYQALGGGWTSAQEAIYPQ